MTYQSASEQFAAKIPARGMSISSAPFLTARNALGQLETIFRSIGAAIVGSTNSNARVNRVEALRAKSDDELARMGLKRDDIVNHVFNDLYYS